MKTIKLVLALCGYAYSASQSDHITFPNLTSIGVSGLIQAVIQGAPIAGFFKQITDQNFAITGGQMAKINDDFLVVGRHRFDGRYNPMGHATFIQDNNVPFVKTISLLSRFSDGRFEEFAFDVEMPLLQGASSEFVVNPNISQHKSSLVWLHNIPEDTILLGHIYGGIISPSLNPFSMNQTSTTAADPTIFAVYLIKDPTVSLKPVVGTHGFGIRVFPNPANSYIDVEIRTPKQRRQPISWLILLEKLYFQAQFL